MGVVLEALDEQLGRNVAVKLLHLDAELAPGAVERLEREAKAAARLGHPNIVRVLDVSRGADEAFLVMEQLTGETLDERIAREGRTSPLFALRIHLQLLDAIGAAHAQGVLHRDVKPSNVFVTRLADGTELVKLLDFGLAFLLEEPNAKKLTATGIVMGTPAYMAPERVRGAEVDVRSDLYSVGVSLYECLAGELPFDAEDPMVLRGKILMERTPSVRDARPEVGVALAEVLSRALARDPAERFQTAASMADALRACLDELSVPQSVSPPSTLEPSRRAVSSSAHTQAAAATDKVFDERSLAQTQAALDAPPLAVEGATRRGYGGGPAADAPGEPRGKETLPRGGVTAPANRILRIAGVSEPATTPASASRRATASGWLIGLGVGAGLGVLVLAGLWGWSRARQGSAPSEPESAETRPTAARPAPDAPEPTPVAPATVSPAAPAAEPVVETLPSGVDPEIEPEVAPAPPASTDRHRARSHPVVVAPVVRPLPPAVPRERPASRPGVYSETLEPDWSRPVHPPGATRRE